MANRFLGTSSNGINISNGSIDIIGASLSASNLSGSTPVKTNSLKQLISSKLDISDVNNLRVELDQRGITNPYNGTIQATDFETVNHFSINDELQKIDNFQESGEGNTNISGVLNVDIIKWTFLK